MSAAETLAAPSQGPLADGLAGTVKIDLKVFAREGSTLAAEELIPVFHRWIEEEELDELLIDVADYRHVHHGPGVILVGHDAHYGFDQGDGRPGLLYSRRHETGPRLQGIQGTSERLRSVLRCALEACRKLEIDPALGGRLRFRADEVRVTVNDRLPSPHEAEAALRSGLEDLAAELFTGQEVQIERWGEPRERVTLRLLAPDGDVESLLGRLSAGPGPSSGEIL